LLEAHSVPGYTRPGYTGSQPSGTNLHNVRRSKRPEKGKELPQIPEEAFRRTDEAPDEEFYRTPRLVTHIDDRAIAAVTQLYRASRREERFWIS
jgi:hypothetical protein